MVFFTKMVKNINKKDDASFNSSIVESPYSKRNELICNIGYRSDDIVPNIINTSASSSSSSSSSDDELPPETDCETFTNPLSICLKDWFIEYPPNQLLKEIDVFEAESQSSQNTGAYLSYSFSANFRYMFKHGLVSLINKHNQTEGKPKDEKYYASRWNGLLPLYSPADVDVLPKIMSTATKPDIGAFPDSSFPVELESCHQTITSTKNYNIIRNTCSKRGGEILSQQGFKILVSLSIIHSPTYVMFDILQYEAHFW